ncbi:MULTISPECIES: hypothetical protein [Flavobacterium]|uniref:Uncharacterized protein n=1 Tax=Flavobacterium jumunjinense TaxID=998845 RepID=A0ABV5GRG7_9FLAO|nr:MULTISPECIES: hypothetical protein [Flavobacterium]
MRLLIFILLFQFIHAQDQEATLNFIDGTSLIGYGSIKKNKIKFRLTKDDDPDIWNEDMVKGITFHGFDFDIKFEYLKTSKNAFYRLFEVIEEGNVSLYVETLEFTSINNRINNGIRFNISKKKYFNEERDSGKLNSTSIFIKRMDEEYPTSLNFGFKKKVLKYFSGCIRIEENIKSGEWFSNDIQTIVRYYNDICAE